MPDPRDLFFLVAALKQSRMKSRFPDRAAVRWISQTPLMLSKRLIGRVKSRKHPLTLTRSFGQQMPAFWPCAARASTFLKIGSQMCESKFTPSEG
jgi:hypothetical protein